MTMLEKDIEQIQQNLQQWFPDHAFIKAAAIQAYPILPEEQALVANAVESRQQEFATGRWLSRQGLQQFGLPEQPIGIGRLRNPLWPENIVGTISHDHDLCAVVLMQKSPTGEAGIGIDLISLPQRAGRMQELAPVFMASAEELTAMSKFNNAIDPAMLLFSLKESAIKALSMQLDDFIDMRAIEFQYTEQLSFSVSGRLINADIFAATTDNYLLTAVIMPVDD